MGMALCVGQSDDSDWLQHGKKISVSIEGLAVAMILVAEASSSGFDLPDTWSQMLNSPVDQVS